MLNNSQIVASVDSHLVNLYQTVYAFEVQRSSGHKDAERVAESAVESAVAALVRASK